MTPFYHFNWYCITLPSSPNPFMHLIVSSLKIQPKKKKLKNQITKSSNFISRKALPGFFLPTSSSLTCRKKPVFSKRDLLRWKVPAMLYWDFWPAEGTSQPVTISKKWKNPSSALRRKRTWIQALPAYRPRAQISNHGRACTQVLFLYITFFLHTYTQSLFSTMCSTLTTSTNVCQIIN
jgi:hypothetical protein